MSILLKNKRKLLRKKNQNERNPKKITEKKTRNEQKMNYKSTKTQQARVMKKCLTGSVALQIKWERECESVSGDKQRKANRLDEKL